MSIKILRWQAGAGGDTILKMATMSSDNLHTNTKFLNSDDVTKTHVDVIGSRQFKYSEITKMSMRDCHEVDKKLLKQQLLQLEAEHTGHWILKSHYYDMVFDQEVIDIVPTSKYLPFLVLATIVKNKREDGLVEYNHPLLKKIKDKELLYKFDLYNFAMSTILHNNLSSTQITLEDTLGGWDSFIIAIKNAGLHIDNKFKDYYDSWLSANSKFMPSEKYKSLLISNNLDHTVDGLTLVERYCLLALAGKKFKIFN